MGQQLFIYLFIFAARTEPYELWQGSGIGLVIGCSFYKETVEETIEDS